MRVCQASCEEGCLRPLAFSSRERSNMDATSTSRIPLPSARYACRIISSCASAPFSFVDISRRKTNHVFVCGWSLQGQDPTQKLPIMQMVASATAAETLGSTALLPFEAARCCDSDSLPKKLQQSLACHTQLALQPNVTAQDVCVGEGGKIIRSYMEL